MLDDIPFTRKIIQTISVILPRTRFVLFLIGALFFIYSILGMELFSFLRYNEEIDGFNQNYNDFLSAFFALIKFSTFESPINQIQDGIQTSQPNFVCFEIASYEEFEKYGQNGCGSPFLAGFFFISFHFILNVFLMSIFIGTIVDGYAEIKQMEDCKITRNFISKLVAEWSNIDQEAKGYISYHQLWHFCPVFMRLYEEDKSFKNISTVPLAKERSEFLQKVKVEAYEAEDGILCVNFHSLLVSLTKFYIENIKSESIVEEKVHTVLEIKTDLEKKPSIKGIYDVRV